MPVPTFGGANKIPDSSSQSLPQIAQSVQLDDSFSDDSSLPYPGQSAVNCPFLPSYAGREERQILTQPAALPPYLFTLPAAGSEDLAFASDAGGIGGSNYENVLQGPVTGWNMDREGYNVGHRQILIATPPGAIGPVIGGEDYGIAVSNAEFQAAFSQYANAPSTQAIVKAI